MDEKIKRFVDAAKAGDDDAATAAAGEVASAFLSDVRRMADALEAIAKSLSGAQV